MKKLFLLCAAALLSANCLFAEEPVYQATITNDTLYALSGNFTATFQEYNDSVVIRGWDGVEGHDLVFTWDNSGWAAINGEAAASVYLTDANFYAAYLYATGGYVGGAWRDENNNITETGNFWFGGYFYYTDTTITDPFFGYANYNWTSADITIPDPSAVENVETDADATATKTLRNGRIIIEKNGKRFDVLGNAAE